MSSLQNNNKTAPRRSLGEIEQGREEVAAEEEQVREQRRAAYRA